MFFSTSSSICYFLLCLVILLYLYSVVMIVVQLFQHFSMPLLFKKKKTSSNLSEFQAKLLLVLDNIKDKLLCIYKN